MIRIVREAIEIEIHPYNMKREGGFCLSNQGSLSFPPEKLSGHDPDPLGYAVHAFFLALSLNLPYPPSLGYQFHFA
jgi:hypothetical protein